jgi:hypothetical protein
METIMRSALLAVLVMGGIMQIAEPTWAGDPFNPRASATAEPAIPQSALCVPNDDGSPVCWHEQHSGTPTPPPPAKAPTPPTPSKGK